MNEIPKIARYTAVDPDGYQFWYRERPELGLNDDPDIKVLTWLCRSKTDCGLVGLIKNYKSDFRNSLKEVNYVS